MTSAASLIPADRPEQAIKAPAPGTNSPAPLFPLASDGRPRTLSDCAGGAKMHARQTHAGRERVARVSYAKQSQAVTLPIRASRQSRCGFPFPYRGSAWIQSRLTSAGRMKARRLSHPSCASDQGHDGIGARLSGFLPLLAAPRHLLMQETFSSSNARLKHCQEPVRVRDVVVSVLSCVTAVHGSNHGSGVLNGNYIFDSPRYPW